MNTQNSLGGSQRSALFPWDNAGASSSVSGLGLGPVGMGSDEISVDHVEVKMRGSSASARSGRASSVLPSRMGSIGGIPASPGTLGQGFNLVDEDFIFDCKALNLLHAERIIDVHIVPANESAGLESRRSDFNVVNLERNSFNFLEQVVSYHLCAYHTDIIHQICQNASSGSTRSVHFPKL